MRAWVQLICKSYSTSHNTSGLERPYRVQGQILSGKWGIILDADVHSLMWASLFSFYLFLSLYFVSKISPFLFPNSSMYRSTVFFKLMASFFNYNYCVYIGISICIHTYTHTTHNVVPLSWHWLHFILLVFAAVTGIVLTIKHLELKATNNNNNKMSCLFFWVCVTSLIWCFLVPPICLKSLWFCSLLLPNNIRPCICETYLLSVHQPKDISCFLSPVILNRAAMYRAWQVSVEYEWSIFGKYGRVVKLGHFVDLFLICLLKFSTWISRGMVQVCSLTCSEWRFLFPIFFPVFLGYGFIDLCHSD